MNRDDPFTRTPEQRPEPESTWLEPPEEPPEAQEEDRHKIFGLGIPRADSRQPAYGQGVIISLITAGGLLLLGIIAMGAPDTGDPPIVERTTTLFWVVAAIVLLFSAAGSQFAERATSRAAEAVGQTRPRDSLATAWSIPFVAALAAILLVATYHNQLMLLLGPLIAFLGTSGALLSRDLLDEADEQYRRVAATIHTLVVHAVAFLAFSAVYINKLDTRVSAPLVGLLGGLLILETLERGGIATPRRVFYAIIGGWIIGQVMVPLNWWPTYGWAGGAVLLAVFYVVAGLLLVKAQRGAIRQRDMAEFGIVGGAALVLVAFLA